MCIYMYVYATYEVLIANMKCVRKYGIVSISTPPPPLPPMSEYPGTPK